MNSAFLRPKRVSDLAKVMSFIKGGVGFKLKCSSTKKQYTQDALGPQYHIITGAPFEPDQALKNAKCTR